MPKKLIWLNSMRGKVLLVFVSLAVCLFVGEVFLRAWGFGRPLQFEPDPKLLWKMVPNQRAFAPS